MLDSSCCELVLLVVLCDVDMSMLSCCVFFFQAEDGIRDLVRSRGLGDVYKRQRQDMTVSVDIETAKKPNALVIPTGALHEPSSDAPVSYTHLTLPTSDLV